MFCPADRPERYAKALERADVVILDLEDAVAPHRKASARESLANADVDWSRAVLRINGTTTAEHQQDLALLPRLGVQYLMLPKAETSSSLEALRRYQVIVLVESPLGVERVADLVQSENVIGAMWGADDLVAGLGGTSSRHPDSRYRDIARYSRARTLMAAKAYHRLAVDAVHMNIADLDGLRQECTDAAASGFDGTAAIHPSQVAVIREAYQPSPEQVRWARELLQAAADNQGVFTFEGQMVDGPIFRQAERIIARA
nr:CoA ester lyase [Kineosporia babensis]